MGGRSSSIRLKIGIIRPPAAIQVAFTIFVVVETWLVPFEGYLVDRFGPRVVSMMSGVMVAAAWMINARATSIPLLYLGAAVGGIGAGGVYGAWDGERAQAVSRSARPRRGNHGDGLRCRLRAHRLSDREHD